MPASHIRDKTYSPGTAVTLTQLFCTQVVEELPLVAKKALALSDEDEDEEDSDEEGKPAPMDVLVDVLLTLLAKPSSPMREAVERVFRAWAEDITAVGLKDILRVSLIQ